MKKIEITIGVEGEVKVEAFGFKGQGCSEEIDIFSKALGGGVIESKKKNEYYAKEPEKVKVGWKK